VRPRSLHPATGALHVPAILLAQCAAPKDGGGTAVLAGVVRLMKILGLGILFLPLLLIVQVVIGAAINAAQHKSTATTVRAFQIETLHSPLFLVVCWTESSRCVQRGLLDCEALNVRSSAAFEIVSDRLR
jgi:hypothetical protein